MKLSKYNAELRFNDKYLIYNTLSSKYALYHPSQKDYMEQLLNNLNKDTYEIEEAEIIRKLAKNGIVVQDDIDEFEKVSYFINKTKYQDRFFNLVIVPTLDCNFRCRYCYEEHKKMNMDAETIENLTEYVKTLSKKIKTLYVSWFGGEPLLEYETIKRLTQNFQEICRNEGCHYYAKMISNGYLFSDDRIDELEGLGIKTIQVTLDGDRENHNKIRPLENGSGTFDEVFNNLIKIAKKDIEIVLRINLDEENNASIPTLLDKIPEDHRKNMEVSISNLFQKEEKINPFDRFKEAIDRGYKFGYTSNTYIKCEATFINSMMVQPDGRVTSCQTAAENGLYFGQIEKYGQLNPPFLISCLKI